MKQAQRAVSIGVDHPALAGHFPGRPIVPGVVWLALAAEAAAEDLGFAATPRRWQRVRFLRPIGPGERLELALNGDPSRFSFTLQTPSGEPVASGQCRHVPLA